MKTGHDHDEVRCATMEELDHDCKLVGEPRTCCVCIGHGCAEALAEIAKRQEKLTDGSKKPNTEGQRAP
jgi:hypothetical protein